MNRCTFSRLKSQLSLTAAGALVGSGLMLSVTPAFAQPTEQAHHHITVVGTHTVTRTVGYDELTDAPIQLTKISRGVSYAHLDLRSYAGANKFKARIKDTAAALCTDLDHRFPLNPPNHWNCVQQSLARAMPKADKVIAQANKPTHNAA